MVRELRKGKAANGLVLANGGIATYQHVVCLSKNPRKTPYPERNPLHNVDPDEGPRIEERPEGEAIVEVDKPKRREEEAQRRLIYFQTYTVEFGRTGKAKQGFVIGRLSKNGHRFLANEEDEATLLQLISDEREPIGRKGWVKNVDGKGKKNVFRFDATEKL